jgi:hypothetical protein
MATWCRRVMPDKSAILADEKSATIHRAPESFLVPLVVTKSPGSARSDSGYRRPSLGGWRAARARFGVGQVRSRDFAPTLPELLATIGLHRPEGHRETARNSPDSWR